MRREAVLGDRLPAARRPAGVPSAREVLVRVGGQHLGERGEPGGGDERVAVERALLRGAVLDDVHDVGPARRTPPSGVPPPIALAKQARSGCTP